MRKLLLGALLTLLILTMAWPVWACTDCGTGTAPVEITVAKWAGIYNLHYLNCPDATGIRISVDRAADGSDDIVTSCNAAFTISTNARCILESSPDRTVSTSLGNFPAAIKDDGSGGKILYTYSICTTGNFCCYWNDTHNFEIGPGPVDVQMGITALSGTTWTENGVPKYATPGNYTGIISLTLQVP